MGFASVDAATGLSGVTCIPPGTVLLLGDSLAAPDGSILMHHFLSTFLKGGSSGNTTTTTTTTTNTTTTNTTTTNTTTTTTIATLNSSTRSQPGKGQSGMMLPTLAKHPQVAVSASVALISFEEGFVKYLTVGRRFGYDLNLLQSQRRFLFIDGIALVKSSSSFGHCSKQAGEEMTEEEEEEGKGAAEGKEEAGNGGDDLVQHIRKALQAWLPSVKGRAVIMLDGMSLLPALGVAQSQIVRLVAMLTQLLAAQGRCAIDADGGANLFIYTHRDIADLEGDGHFGSTSVISNAGVFRDRTWRWLAHLATIIVEVRPLSSGATREVHGELVCLRGGQYGTATCSPMHVGTHLYRITDNNFLTFPKGSIM